MLNHFLKMIIIIILRGNLFSTKSTIETMRIILRIKQEWIQQIIIKIIIMTIITIRKIHNYEIIKEVPEIEYSKI